MAADDKEENNKGGTKMVKTNNGGRGQGGGFGQGRGGGGRGRMGGPLAGGAGGNCLCP